jgi:hypothetical protein
MRTALLLLGVSLSTACAYHAPDAPTPIVVVPSTTPASIRLVSGSRPDYTTAVIATVLTADGRGVPNMPLAFTTASGTVTPGQTTTDVEGRATAIVASPSATTVSASAGTLTTSIQVTGASAPAPLPPLPIPPTPVPVPPEPPSKPPVPIPPVAFTVFLTPIATTAGTSVALNANPSVPITAAAWTFGDGTTQSTGSGSVVHSWTTAGAYTLSVVVTDTLGRTASTSAPVTVAAIVVPPPPPPSPPPTLLPALTCTVALHVVVCNVTAAYGSTALLSSATTRVDWDFGDGVAQTVLGSPLATRTYGSAGTYTIFATVTATTVDGPKTATTSKIVTVL